MGRIIFTDTIGAAVLTNGKPAPSNRFSNWTPHPLPFGDKANRQSDAALTMIRLRDDFGATFDLTGIPVVGSPTNLLDPFGDIQGTLGATPTSFGTAAPNAVTVTVTPADAGAPKIAPGFNGLFARCVRDNGTGNTAVAAVFPTLTNTHPYAASLWAFVPPGVGVSDAWISFDANVTSAVAGHYDFTNLGTWQLLTATATCNVGASSQIGYHVVGSTGAYSYTDLWILNDLSDASLVRPVDLADRLAYHLENGGTCQVETGDFDNNIYATCGLAPGAQSQPPVLSDKKNLEYTLSLNLVNLAGSPARMRCHYL